MIKSSQYFEQTSERAGLR